MAPNETVKDTFEALGEFFFPSECLLCRALAPGRTVPFCRDCESKLISDSHRCVHCATPLPDVLPNDDCIRCRGQGWKFAEVRTLGPYREELRDVVIQMKRPHADVLRRAIALLISEQLMDIKELESNAEDKAESPIVVAVPNHWTHGFLGAADVAGDLAKHLALHSGWDYLPGIIRRIRRTGKQGMLAWSERPKNVKDCFCIKAQSRIADAHVLLVDDVLTSGATCAELSKLLARAGARRITVCVAARGTGAKETSKPEKDVDQS
ncbi:MAG: phosphoribosyltransferase family protein [Planctomycetota bacterium]